MRGFRPILPIKEQVNSYNFLYVKEVFERISRSNGFDFVFLPFVESADLYFRTSGADSDVCSKELFEIRRYKDEFRNWVLRPEGTASCVQSIIDLNLMQDNKLIRYCYFDAMFRYSRPQMGRWRQFYQAGWEIIGSNSIYIDFDAIVCAVSFLKELNLDFSLEINTIGSAADRQIYRKQLNEIFNLEDGKDPLKILDKIDEISDYNIPSNIPLMQVNEQDQNNFNLLLSYLKKKEIKYIHNPFLVRGLDYYNSTVFEIKINGTTVIGGGRYDGLMQQLGGGKIPAFGFAAGIERIILSIDHQHVTKKVALICLEEYEYAYKILEKIRAKYEIFSFWDLPLKKALEQSDKSGYRYAIIIGSNEVQNGIVTIKDLRKGIQIEQQIENIAELNLAL